MLEETVPMAEISTRLTLSTKLIEESNCGSLNSHMWLESIVCDWIIIISNQ